MTLKIIVKLIEKILGMTDYGDEPRADMYLPDRLLAMALLLLSVGIACTVFSFFSFELWKIIGAVLGIVLGLLALLCWKNQAIHVISEEQFTYTTMFGNTRTYSFSDIQKLRQNKDSFTLFVNNEKVHIESMAVISDRLNEYISRALFRRTVLESPYLNMSSNQLSGLKDEELPDAVWTRIESKLLNYEDLSRGLNCLNEEQRIFYAVNCLDAEVNNGGLCQFFVNTSRTFAPVVGEYLEIIGATEHRKLYDTFIEKYQINTNDLSSFDSDTVEVFQSQYERYPFEEYDDAFYESEPLQNYLISFVKKNIEKF